MMEQGIDWLGVEYKRTANDFHLRRLKQENCCCSICHGIGAKWEFRYVIRNYASPRVKGKICKTLQAHERSFWICQECLDNMMNITGLQIAERKAEESERTEPIQEETIEEIARSMAKMDWNRSVENG